ncbi:MAG: hypothetical protein Fur007_12250 [Rhodoferax sp.]
MNTPTIGRRFGRIEAGAIVLALAALVSACKTMPEVGGAGSAGLGDVATALSATGLTQRIPGANSNAVADMVQGASSVLKEYTAQEQRELGVQFSSVLLGARPLLRHDAVQRYVNQVGGWVAQHADSPVDADGKPIAFAWRFGVIDTDAVNAYATPGGFVFVTVGLMRQLNSEAELAAVLAHEIAHVVRAHYIAAIRKGGFAQVLGGAVQMKAGSGALSTAMVNAVRNIYQKGLDQSDEYEADRLGLLYAARAGYAPTGLPRVLKMYAANSQQDANYTLFFSTHPAPSDRVARLEPLLASKFAAVEGVVNDGRYRAVRRQIK